MPELEQCFTDAEEMIFYDSINDCIDKAKFYLAPRNYELCISIGERARKRAETEHTWTNRFNKIVEYLNL